MSAGAGVVQPRRGVNRSFQRSGANKPPDAWWSQVTYQRRKRGSGYVVRVGRKLGQLSFCFYTSRPLPDQQQAQLWAEEMQSALAAKRPAKPLIWWTWRVVPRTVGGGKQVWVGTVRKWSGATSWPWREIAPCDSEQEARRIATQTVQAGQWLEQFELRAPRAVAE